MSTLRAREPGWADVLEDHAAEWSDGAPARRPARCVRGGGARVLPAARTLGAWRRLSIDGRCTRSSAAPRGRPGRDRPRRARPSARPISARARVRPGRRPLLVRRAGRRRAARVGACPQARRRGGERNTRRAGVPRACRARARAAGPCGHGAHRRRARPVVALGRPVRSAREPRARGSRPARACRLRAAHLTVVGSINLDLVDEAVERLPRPGETLSGATL